MDKTELESLLSKRSGTERRVYDALLTHGKMTDRQLREFLHSPGSGPRDALAKLLPLGVVRHAGKAETKNKPMQYEATPLGQIDKERERFKLLKPKGKKRSARTAGARLAELRKMESGDARKWHPTRDKILAALPLLSDAFHMSFWESVPRDELELALKEIEELQVAATDALIAGRERLAHEKRKDTIEKLERTEGRTFAEKQTAAAKADRLRKKLIPS